MKCILDGKQAAILVPTVLVSNLHHLRKTLFRYPVHISPVRFLPGTDQSSIRRIANGTADLVIGTHRLLQKTCCSKISGC